MKAFETFNTLLFLVVFGGMLLIFICLAVNLKSQNREIREAASWMAWRIFIVIAISILLKILMFQFLNALPLQNLLKK
jgi:hypothetical protein